MLETEPFKLLTEGTYLTAWPVPLKDQTDFAATPTHPTCLYALRASSFAGV